MKKARILIVEDEAIIALEIESQLQSLGYEITSLVDNGEDAIAKAEVDKPDIILMDIHIKGEMDGIEAADIIRSRFEIPIVYLTAFDDKKRLEKAKQTLPYGYLLKPVQDKDLKVTVEMALYIAKVNAERNRVEEKLIKSETFLSKTGQIAKVGGWEIDGETKKVFWTKELYRITEVPLDYDPSSLEKKAIVFFNAEDQIILDKVIQRAFVHNEPYDLEFLITTAKGNKKWVRTICEPVVVNDQVVKLTGTFQDISKRKQAEEVLQKKTIDIGERVKELNCLHGISELVEKLDNSLAEILQEVVDLIPPSWQFPDITSSRLVFDDQEFKTKKFRESKWKQAAKIIVHGKPLGILEVFYLERKREEQEGPFLKEERNLLNSIAERLGKIIARIQSEENLRKAHQQLRQFTDQLKNQNIYLQNEINLTHNIGKIISKNKEFLKVLSMAEKVATSQTTVLITGETGTGKELIARIVHDLSDRKDTPLIKVNCAVLPANLIESELFGHEKGAFTGAISCRKGRFELADNTTIFLDEIGDLPLDLQSKLLRVLQEGEFERLGGTKTIKVNVRVLAATNKNLKKLSAEGKFRSDLFYRLAVFPIECPPLRDRKDDIPLLVNHFIEIFNTKVGKKIEIIPQHVLNSLQEYHWPGNIRELENIIERAVILSSGNQLELGNWLSKDTQSTAKSSIPSLDDVQKEHILHVLRLTNGKVSGESGAAKILNMSRSTLLGRMKKLGIKVERNTVQI